MKRRAEHQKSWMAAVTFAEAGEWETARTLIPDGGTRTGVVSTMERIFAAVAFAESGLHAEAIRLATDTAPRGRGARPVGLEGLGLAGAHMRFGVVRVSELH